MPKHYQYTIGDVPENIKTKHAFRILRGKATTNYGVADAIYYYWKEYLQTTCDFNKNFILEALDAYRRRTGL